MSAYVIGFVTSVAAGAFAWLIVRLRKFGRDVFKNQRAKRQMEMIAAVRAEFADDGNGSLKSAVKRIESKIDDLAAAHRAHRAYHEGMERGLERRGA